MKRSFFGILALAAVGMGALVGCGDDSTGGGGTGATGAAGGAGGSGGAGGGTLTGQPIKILNWNVHNFFDTVEDTTNTENDSQTQAAYNNKLDAVASVIGEIDPDIIVLQEVENEAVLADIDEALGSKYPEQDLIPGNDPRGVDIGALSKISFTSVVSHLDETFVVEGTVAPEFNFTRDLLEYHFKVGDQDVVLLGVHYKAKGPPDNPDKRLAEAQRTRAIADELTAANPDLAVLVLGDYNDLPDSPPLDAITGKAPDLYVDSASFAPEADRWSFDYMGAHELIDHQMANPKMAGRLDKSSIVIPHNTTVGTASDHSPVAATYYLE
ncbi:MAG: endonuclease/exonuclease/phosphatase family protein [Polyangiaceae bacterium]